MYYSEYQVSTKDCNARESLNVLSLLNYMQDAAWQNASELKFSTHDLMKHGITWVMNRMKIQFHHMPLHQEVFTIETWPAAMDKYYTQRDFRIWGANKRLLGEATSNWLVMDMKDRKLIPIPEFISESGLTVDRDNMEPASGKIKFDDNRVENQTSIDVSWFDLDINNHVNNVKLYQWLLDSLGGEFLQSNMLKEIDVIFKHEGKYGDLFESKSYFVPNENLHYHCLLNTNTGQESVLGKTRFERI